VEYLLLAQTTLSTNLTRLLQQVKVTELIQDFSQTIIRHQHQVIFMVLAIMLNNVKEKTSALLSKT
jgi:hypothetical protein